MPDTAGVLIAEIPKNRPGQVNYHMSDYRDFFGWREGVTRFVSFRRVSDDGTVAEFEFSTVVISDSGNFRFELAGARGQLNYGSASAIGVYVRVATREFFYCILRPGEAAFDSIGRLLDRREGVPAARGRGGRPMRSTQMTVSELRQEWADAPFWRIPPSERSDNF
jgi:hypothetical protein